MELSKLKEVLQNSGIVGAGGAGFPSYGKLDSRADTIILNCAECEPLLKLHRQVLQKYAAEILTALNEVAAAVSAERIIIAIKPGYKETVEAVKAQLPSFPKAQIGLLPEIYPAGDEVVTIYETTGRLVAPGALPITVGVTVFNVETAYNIYRALFENAPVTHKYITITGAVANPITLLAPLGVTYGSLIEQAGGATVSAPVLIGGGPMTGRIVSRDDVVTKTSNAVLVMPQDAYIVLKRTTPVKIDLKRIMAACCQCHMCTDLCSRNLLGMPIEPHKIMRAVSVGSPNDSAACLDSFFCSSCGLCEMYSCGQGLNPRTVIGEIKGGLRANGIKPPAAQSAPVNSMRSARRVPMSRLTARLGLSKYDVPAPLDEKELPAESVKIMLSQHIGAPAAAAVKQGDIVSAGDVIGNAPEDKLSVSVHTPISGRIAAVTERYVIISKKA